MGAQMVYLREPVTRKVSEDGGGELGDGQLPYGVTGMQGWRRNMEDAHLAAIELDEGLSLFGVFDGHMGRGVSHFAAQRLPQLLKDTEAYKQGDYVKALERAFLAMDETLREADSRRAVEELDKPDKDYPSEPVAVPKRMLHRFLERRGLQVEPEEAGKDGGTAEAEALPVGTKEAVLDAAVPAAGKAEPQPVRTESEVAKDHQKAAVGDADLATKEAKEKGVTSPLPSEVPSEEDLEDQLHDLPDEDEEGEEFSLTDGDDEADFELDGFMDDEEMFDGEEMALVDPGDITRDSTPEGQGCTAVVVLVVRRPEGEGPRLICANAGDSRAILSRRGKVVALSDDHKPENDVEFARIKKAGGFVQNLRVQGDLNLSRAFGDLRYKIPASFPPEEQVLTCFPEVRTIPLLDEDEFLVIGCDGIWERMENQEMVDFVRPRIAKATKLSKICEEICDNGLCPSMDANKNEGFDGTGCDNMTVLVAQIKAVEACAKREAPEALDVAAAAAPSAALVAAEGAEPAEKRPRTVPAEGDGGSVA